MAWECIIWLEGAELRKQGKEVLFVSDFISYYNEFLFLWRLTDQERQLNVGSVFVKIVNMEVKKGIWFSKVNRNEWKLLQISPPEEVLNKPQSKMPVLKKAGASKQRF